MSEPPHTRQTPAGTEVLDIVRRRWVALTPEEWVRQTLIHHLHHDKLYPLELMQVEGSIAVNTMSRRCDIVIYNPQMKPLIIVECKRPSVPINQQVADQASRYNTALHVPYLLLTNGRQTLLLRVDAASASLQALPSIPTWQELLES